MDGDSTQQGKALLPVGVSNAGHVLKLQEYVKCRFALDEADDKGWFPLHEAVVQPFQQVLEIVLDGKRLLNHFD